MEAHIDDVILGTTTQEDHLLLLQEFFTFSRKIISVSNSRNVSSCKKRWNPSL